MFIHNKPYEAWLAESHFVNHSWKGKVGACLVHDQVIEWVKMLLRGQRSKTYLEVGTYDGVMISLLAEAFPDKRFIAVDSFCQTETTGGGHFGYFVENTKHLDNVFLWMGDSSKMLPMLNSVGEKLDFGFVDGEHTYECVKNDLYGIYQMCNPGAVIAAHDLNIEGVRKAVYEFSEEIGCMEVSSANCAYIKLRQ